MVKAFIVLGTGCEPSDELAEEIKAFVRDHHSAYAYPRQIEFVRELPKTLTGRSGGSSCDEAKRKASGRQPALPESKSDDLLARYIPR